MNSKNVDDPGAARVIGAAALACVLLIAVQRPVTLPLQAAALWRAPAFQPAARPPQFGRTYYIDGVTVGAAGSPEQVVPSSSVEHADVVVVVRGQRVAVRGWAIDPDNGWVAADRFVFRVDRGPWQTAQYHQRRPDVAIALALSLAAESGFSFDLGTSVLRAGTHTIEMATSSNHSRRRILRQLIVLAVKDR